MRALLVLVLLAAAGAAGCHRRDKSGSEAATRSIEARLGGEHHRPFRAGRAPLSLDAEAALERRGELQALGEALLADGRLDAAAAALQKAPASPSLQSDLGALALLRGDAEGALARVDAALRAAPKSGAALWNRALALRALGLPRGAAAAFDEVASLGEPGWSAEARERAAALRADVAARDKSWKQAQAAGRALVTAGAPPPASVLQRYPTFVRHYLYHAVRAAPSPERLRALAPLAATLDARDGGDVLSSLVARTAARDLKARAPLAATYARLSGNPDALDKPAVEQFLGALRRAHEDDLLLGTLVLLERNGDELQRLARATNDPWYRGVAAFYEARDLVARDKLVEAESVVVPALDDCRRHRLDFRCVYLASMLTDVYRRQNRSDDAERTGRAALRDAWQQAPSRELELFMRVGDAARGRAAFSLMDAFLDEGVRVKPDDCASRRWAYEMAAEARMFELDPSGARAALDRAPRCDQPMTLVRASVVVDLARRGLGGAEAAHLPDELAAARKTLGRGGRAFSLVYEARHVIGSDRAAGHKLLAAALSEAAQAPAGDVDARKARAYAHLTAAVEDALAGDGDAALAALAADIDARPPPRCALGVAVDDERSVAVVRGSDGTTAVAVDRQRTSTALDGARLVPAALRERLSGCPEVAVFAPPPVHGLPELLPSAMAWSYRLRPPLAPSERTPRDRHVVVTNPTPPPSLALPRLADWRAPAAGERTTVVEGAAATPARVLAEIADATEIEVHAHGLVDSGLSDASVLALSPDDSGRFALSARDVARASLRNRPVVILGACSAARAAGYHHEAWGLPLAFVRAGAAAVFASPAPIGDADAAPFFSAVLARIRDGAAPARALRDERLRVVSRDSGNWVRQLLVFQ